MDKTKASGLKDTTKGIQAQRLSDDIKRTLHMTVSRFLSSPQLNHILKHEKKIK